MKFFAIFATVLAVSCALPQRWGIHELSVALQDPNTDPAMVPYLQQLLNELMMEAMGQPQATPVEELSLTLHEISEALQNPNTDPALVPYLEDALNTLMNSLISGNQQESIIIGFPAGLLPAEGIVAPAPVAPVVVPTTPVVELSLTLHEISEALQNPNTDPALVPYLENALNALMASLMAGNQQGSIVVAIPAGLLPAEGVIAPTPVVNPSPSTPMEVVSLTLQELSDALQNPSTDPALIPYLEDALNTMMYNLMSGIQQESISVVVPAGLLPAVVAPAPVVVAPSPVNPTPVNPTPVETPAASAPLVQIIVNVNQQEAAVVPSPVVVPNPVETPAPVPVNPIDVIAIIPTPVETPAPVPVNPIDVIAIIPTPVETPAPVPVNPVDVIAIIPTPVETPAPVPVNPVDVIAITPPEAINPVDVIAIIPPQLNPIDIVAITAPEVNPIDVASPVPVVPAGVAGVVGPIL